MKKIKPHRSMLGMGVSCQNPRKEDRQDRRTDGQRDRWTDRQTEDGGVAILDKRELGLHITRLLVMT